MINIAKIEAISLEETIDITIDLDGELHNFRVIVHDCPEFKCLREMQHLDKWEKPLRNSEKKKIRKYLEEYFKEEGR